MAVKVIFDRYSDGTVIASEDYPIASAMSVNDGHLLLANSAGIVAVFAPGKWADATVTD